MNYKVHVCRTGYAHADITVSANSKRQAYAKAIEEAGNHDFSENTSEYSVEGVTELIEENRGG